MSKVRDSGCIDCLCREMLNPSLFSLIACVSKTLLIQSAFDKCCWLEEDSSGILHSNFENGPISLRHCLHGNSVCDELESHYPADTWASAAPSETPPLWNEGHRDSPSLWFIYSNGAKVTLWFVLISRASPASQSVGKLWQEKVWNRCKEMGKYQLPLLKYREYISQLLFIVNIE